MVFSDVCLSRFGSLFRGEVSCQRIPYQLVHDFWSITSSDVPEMVISLKNPAFHRRQWWWGDWGLEGTSAVWKGKSSGPNHFWLWVPCEKNPGCISKVIILGVCEVYMDEKITWLAKEGTWKDVFFVMEIEHIFLKEEIGISCFPLDDFQLTMFCHDMKGNFYHEKVGPDHIYSIRNGRHSSMEPFLR